MKREALLASLSLAAIAVGAEAKAPAKNNVLLIICDDLRTELECYNHPIVKTPNINRIATNGVVFEQAFCNIAVSGASRGSILTGLRPTRDRFEHWNIRIDKQAPEAVTLNQAFHDAGYYTVSNGKIFHHQDEASNKYWDKIMPYGSPLEYRRGDNIEYLDEWREQRKKRGLFYDDADHPEQDYLDTRMVTQSLEDMKMLAGQDKPFFLAVGFIRPHLPFIAPKKYWDMYPAEKISLPDNYVLKEGNDIPQKALTFWGELTAYRGTTAGPYLSDEAAINMIRGYYACVSHIDNQIGRLLDQLQALGLDQNTTVVLLGDHGWNLGEHGMWCKHSIMYTSLHAPLIISTPDGLKNHRTSQIVEYLDLYPTLCDFAGIKKPKQLEGESLMPLVKDKEAKSKGYAIARWENSFTYVDGSYSYTEWWNKQDKKVDAMLFDHISDPAENYNVEKKPWYKGTAGDLNIKLRALRGKDFLITVEQ